jgi:hypothetical protein
MLTMPHASTIPIRALTEMVNPLPLLLSLSAGDVDEMVDDVGALAPVIGVGVEGESEVDEKEEGEEEGDVDESEVGVDEVEEMWCDAVLVIVSVEDGHITCDG